MLMKIYQLRCDGPHLTRRLGLPPVPRHTPFSDMAETSAKARRAATHNGWGRVTKTLPITADPHGPTSTMRFDLCPSCKKALGETDAS